MEQFVAGLTLLLPYIITTRRNWSECKLRVFTLANKKEDLLYEQRKWVTVFWSYQLNKGPNIFTKNHRLNTALNIVVCCSMASLLSKFRIDYSDLKVIPDITKKPMDETNTFFDQLIKDFVVNDSTVEDNGKSGYVNANKEERWSSKVRFSPNWLILQCLPP